MRRVKEEGEGGGERRRGKEQWKGGKGGPISCLTLYIPSSVTNDPPFSPPSLPDARSLSLPHSCPLSLLRLKLFLGLDALASLIFLALSQPRSALSLRLLQFSLPSLSPLSPPTPTSNPTSHPHPLPHTNTLFTCSPLPRPSRNRIGVARAFRLVPRGVPTRTESSSPA